MRSRCCLCVYVCVSPIVARQRLSKGSFIVAWQRLGKYPLIVARQRLGKTPLIVAWQRLYKIPPIIARQQLGRNVTAVTTTHATIEELLAISSSQNFLFLFYVRSSPHKSFLPS
jgi:hypothetical protein